MSTLHRFKVFSLVSLLMALGVLLLRRAAESDPALEFTPRTKLEYSRILPQNFIKTASASYRVAPEIISLFKSEELLEKQSYSILRSYLTQQLLKDYEIEIQKELGEDYGELKEWSRSHQEIFEDLCSAIDEEHDNVIGVFFIFNEIRKKFPNELVEFKDLAIATAVVWDDDDRSGYRYVKDAAKQASAKYDSADDTNALDNFCSLVKNDLIAQDRLKLPWELLIYVVNQRTPIEERNWAIERYGENQTRLAKNYTKVPYDHQMKATHFKECKLRGKEYTLPNILKIGACCVQQSDFSSRVNKIFAIPSAPVTGTTRGLGGHQWVTWIEASQISENRFSFEVKSSGKHASGHHYVGTITDPHTGKRITDKVFENDVQVLAKNVFAKRQIDFAVRLYPQVRQSGQLSKEVEIAYLKGLVGACPQNLKVWSALSTAIKEGTFRNSSDEISKFYEQFLVAYEGMPDIVWNECGSFIDAFADIKTQTEMYEKLSQKFESQGRPDLLSRARLSCADLLIRQNRSQEALDGLKYCVSDYPSERRYQIQLLDKINDICKEKNELKTQQVQVFSALTSHLSGLRRKTPGKYFQRVYERAIQVFTDNGELTLAREAIDALKSFDQ